MSVQKKNAVTGRLALLVTTLIWGSSFVVLKNTLETVPTFYVLAFRFSGAAVLMLLLGIKDLKDFNKGYLFSGALMGAALFAGYSLQTYGLYFTTPAKNAFLTTTYCVIVPFIYWAWEKKRPDAYSVSAAFICLIGVGFVSLEKDFSVNMGDLLTVSCGLFYAIHIVMTSRFVKGRSIVLLTMTQFAFAGAFAWIFALITSPFPVHMSATNVESIAFLCVMCTAVCFVLQTFGQKYTPPSTAAIILTLESVFGAAFSVLIYHERMSLKLVIGFVLIFSAVLTCETKLGFLKHREKLEETI